MRHREVKELAQGRTVNRRIGLSSERLATEPDHSRKLGIAGGGSHLGGSPHPCSVWAKHLVGSGGESPVVRRRQALKAGKWVLESWLCHLLAVTMGIRHVNSSSLSTFLVKWGSHCLSFGN